MALMSHKHHKFLDTDTSECSMIIILFQLVTKKVLCDILIDVLLLFQIKSN